jgi:hypothetical protein
MDMRLDERRRDEGSTDVDDLARVAVRRHNLAVCYPDASRPRRTGDPGST